MVTGVLAAMVAAQEARALEGRWQGTLEVGEAHLRLILEIAVTEDQLYLGTLTSVDQGNAVIPVDIIQRDARAVRFEVRTVGVSYEGALDEQGTHLTGTWTQGVALPLDFERVAAAEPLTIDDGAAGQQARSVAEDDSFGFPLQLEVPVSPTPFAGGGATHVAYELHVTNFGGAQLSVRRIDILDAEASRQDAPLATFEGAELHSVLRPVGAPPREASHRRHISDLRDIPAGRRAVAYLWITVEDEAAVPERVYHRVSGETHSVEGAEAEINRHRPPVLGAPLAGTHWMAVNGPGNASIHRRALLPAAGRASIAQRFAIDWVKLDQAGRTFAGDPEDNAAYYAYGEEVLAVADAVVVDVERGIPENVPGLTSRAVAMTAETIAGNYVVLDVGDGFYAFYGHLQPDGILVEPGDRVSRGDVIALVGNSGNSTEPHLHFHVADGAGGLASEGIPYLLEAFDLLGEDGTAEPRSEELPMQNAVVRFPDKP